jgi:hypothetical protein
MAYQAIKANFLLNNAETRTMLAKLADLAARRQVAVVCVSHLNKGAADRSGKPARPRLPRGVRCRASVPDLQTATRRISHRRENRR